MYAELQVRYRADFGNGKIILHEAGRNGARTGGKFFFSAVGMAEMLEGMWRVLVEPAFVAALDIAVRRRNAEIGVGGGDALDAAQEKVRLVYAAEGLADVNGMTPEGVLEMVWAKQMEELRRDPALEAQTALADAGLAPFGSRVVEQRLSKQQLELSTKEMGVDGICEGTRESACSTVRNMVNGQEEEVRDTTLQKSNATDLPPLKALLDALPNVAPQMQFVPRPDQEPFIIHAMFSTSEAADKLDQEYLEMRRKRADTAHSDLAYVPPPPPRTPTRAKKDIYPLGFYGGSGQRYPPFHPTTVTSPEGQVDVHSSSPSERVPRRKPVPLPLPVIPQPPRPINAGLSQTHAGCQTPEATPSDANFADHQVTYPAIPKSQSQGLFTQSFPISARGNPRTAETDKTIPAADYAQLAGEAQDTIRPFSDTPVLPSSGFAPPQQRQQQNQRPPLHTTATCPDALEAHQIRKALAKDFAATKPMPPLPEPDFIAPRPATKQRYVSAGGNAKLHDRQEIAGPAFTHTASGGSMSKDELFKMLNDPDFIKTNFGDVAAARTAKDVTMAGGGARARGSQESERSFVDRRVSGQSSVRNSRDSLTLLGDKRGRTDSGGSLGSLRLGRLKRVFSRKSSDGE